MASVKKPRKCSECKRLFADPSTFYAHKSAYGCKSDEVLKSQGYVLSKLGWTRPR